MPPARQPPAKPPTTPISSAFSSSSLHRMLPLPTPTQDAPWTGSPRATKFSASLVTSAEKCTPAVSRITCRTRGSAAAGTALRLIITTSAQEGSAISARRTADPTCPVPPMIKTRKAISISRPTSGAAWPQVSSLRSPSPASFRRSASASPSDLRRLSSTFLQASSGSTSSPSI